MMHPRVSFSCSKEARDAWKEPCRSMSPTVLKPLGLRPSAGQRKFPAAPETRTSIAPNSSRVRANAGFERRVIAHVGGDRQHLAAGVPVEGAQLDRGGVESLLGAAAD